MEKLKSLCLNCKKRKSSLFKDLSKDELKILDNNRYTVSYKSGEVICKAGTKPLGLVCLNKGKVKNVRRGINGSDQIVGLKKSVDFIGFRALMGESICLSTSITLEDSTICIIKKKDFFKVIENNKNLAFKIIKSFAHSLAKSDDRLLNLTQKHIKARLAETLLLINDIYGVDLETGNLNVKMRRSDLAGLSNMTTANAIRVLSSFNKDNLVTVNNQRIKILDMNSLKNISNFNK